MRYFLDTTETIADGVGFSQFGGLHICWLAVFVLIVIVSCIWFKKADAEKRNRWKKVVAILVVLDEIFKMVMLTIGKRYTLGYLPLHLCSINIFMIAVHAWRPSDTLGSFLYTVCIPGALAALLFPTWTALPFGNFMHMHSFTVHILLALYPIVLAVSGEIKVSIKLVPKCLLLLIGMAVPIYIFNLIFDTNYMFLMHVDAGNPLLIFEQMWGNHLLGFPVLITAIVLVMYIPVEIYRKMKTKNSK